MSLINFAKLRKHRYKEAHVVRMVGEILCCEEYYIKSISNNYPRQDRIRFELHKLCEFGHPGGFDLLILNKDFNTIGVEVKSVLSMSSYNSALGQCIYYLDDPKYRVKEAVIFGYKFQNDKIYEEIRRHFIKLREQTGLPIKIRTIARNYGFGQKEI